MRTARKFFSLAPQDQRLILQAASWVAFVRAGLWLVRFQTLNRALARFTPMPGTLTPVRVVKPEQIAWAVRAAARRIPHATCLTQALAAQTMLARNGYAANLKIGVALGEKNNLHAHAWLERDGQVLIGGEESLENFTPLVDFKA